MFGILGPRDRERPFCLFGRKKAVIAHYCGVRTTEFGLARHVLLDPWFQQGRDVKGSIVLYWCCYCRWWVAHFLSALSPRERLQLCMQRTRSGVRKTRLCRERETREGETEREREIHTHTHAHNTHADTDRQRGTISTTQSEMNALMRPSKARTP